MNAGRIERRGRAKGDDGDEDDEDVGTADDCACHCEDYARATGDPAPDYRLCAHEWRAPTSPLPAIVGRREMPAAVRRKADAMMVFELLAAGRLDDDCGVTCARCGMTLAEHHAGVRRAAGEHEAYLKKGE